MQDLCNLLGPMLALTSSGWKQVHVKTFETECIKIKQNMIRCKKKLPPGPTLKKGIEKGS